VEKDPSVDASALPAPTKKKTSKKVAVADKSDSAQVVSITPLQVVPALADVAAVSTSSPASVTDAVRSHSHAPPATAQVHAATTAVGSRESVVDLVGQLPQPVSVTGTGAAWRSRKSFDGGGQSVEDMLSILERRGSTRNAVSQRTQVIVPDEVSDPDDVSSGHVSDENEVHLDDAESSKSDVTSDHSKASGSSEKSSEEDVAAEDDGDSAEDIDPEPLPKPSVKKSSKAKVKSSTKPVENRKAQGPGKVGEGSEKVRGRKKPISSAGVTKRVPISRASTSSAVKSGNFYDAKANPKPPVTRRKKPVKE